MKSVLSKCNRQDLEYIDAILDSYVALTNDSKRKSLIEIFGEGSDSDEELLKLIEKQILYYGSSEVGYIVRAIFTENGGISSTELVDDVAKKLKIPSSKKGASIESQLERIATSVIDKELLSKKPEELIKFLKDLGGDNVEEFVEYIKKNGLAITLPLIYKFFGPKMALAMTQNILVGVISYFIGGAAARKILEEIIKRNPLINSLGPVVWGFSAAWLAFDLQGPAYRKTIPICLYLGIVSLRDGLEEK